MTKTPAITVPADEQLSSLGPVAFDEIARDLWFANADAESRVDSAADDLHRANGERGRATRSGTYWDNTLTDTIAQVEADPARPVRGRISVTAGDVLASYRAAVAARDALWAHEARMTAVYEARGSWPRYLQTTGTDAHIHSGTRCSTCNKTRRTPFVWLVELSGMPIAEAIKTFKVTMCTTCYPDAPVVKVAADPNVCTGSTVEGTRKAEWSGGRMSTAARYVGDCTCGATGIRVKQDGTPAKHKPAKAPTFAEGARVTHAGDPGRVWIVREVRAGKVEKVAVEDAGKPGANRVFLAVDCTAAPVEAPAATVASALAEVEQAGETIAAIQSAAAAVFGEPVDPATLPRRTVAAESRPAREVVTARVDEPAGETFACASCGREARMTADGPEHTEPAPHVNGIHVPTLPAAVEAPATLVPTFGPFDEIEHPGHPGAVLVVDRVTEAGKVIAHPVDDLDSSVRVLAAKCRMLRTADHAAAAKTIEDKAADLVAVARKASRTHAKADLDRLRNLVARYGLTVKTGGHVIDTTGYHVTQGMPSLAVMLETNRSLVLRTVRAGEPIAGTWAALAAEQERTQIGQRVHIGPAGKSLSGTVAIMRTVAATDRYSVELSGFGAGGLVEGSMAFVDAGAQYEADIARMLRGNDWFVRALDRSLVEAIRSGKDTSHTDAAVAFLADIPIHLERGWGEGPVWCPTETPARVTAIRSGATCRACEQAIAMHQLMTGLRADQREGRPVRDALGGVIDVPDGVTVTVDYRLFWAGRVIGECGHPVARSEYQAGLKSCERCPAGGDQDDDDETCTAFVQWDDRDTGGECGAPLPCSVHPTEDDVRARELEQLAARVEGDQDEQDAAVVAGAVDRQDDAVLTDVLAAAGEPVGPVAQGVEVPAQRPAGTFTDQREAWEMRVGSGTDDVGGTVGGGKSSADPWAAMRKQVVKTTWEALESLLRLDGFTPGQVEGYGGTFLSHPAGVHLSVDQDGTNVMYPDDNIGDGEYGEGVGWVRLPVGTNYGAMRDVVVGLVAVAGGTAVPATPTREQVNELLDLVGAYGQAAAIGGDTARGREAMAEAKMAAGDRFLAVRSRLVELLWPAGKAPADQHVTTIDERDAAGHWGWHCLAPAAAHPAGDGDGSGYETADEVIEAATAHGPLAADSLRPADDVEALIIPGEGGEPGGPIGTGAQVEIDGARYRVPDRTPHAGIVAPARIGVALRWAGYEPAGGDYYGSLTGEGIMVRPSLWGSVMRGARAAIMLLVERARPGGVTLDEVRTHLGAATVGALPIGLRELLTEMYAGDEILASDRPAAPDVRFYPMGRQCDECESRGENCSAHRTYAQRVRGTN